MGTPLEDFMDDDINTLLGMHGIEGVLKSLVRVCQGRSKEAKELIYDLEIALEHWQRRHDPSQI